MHATIVDVIRQQVRIVVDPMLFRLQTRLFGQANAPTLQPTVLPSDGVVTIVNEAVQQGSLALSSITESYQAGESITAGTCVRIGSDGAVYSVQSSMPTHAKTCVGIALADASSGQPCRICPAGFVSLPGVWSFPTIGVPVFIQADGTVAPTVPTTGFVQQVGIVVQSQAILVALDTTVVLL